MSLFVEDESRVAGPPRRRLGLAMLVIAAAQLLLVLDGTIMNVALPSIRTALGLAESELSLVVGAYTLAFGGLMLVGGRAGDLYGHRRMFRVGLVVFAAASLLGGFAVDGPTLIGARVLQGVGAAIAAPNALSVLTTTFPAGPARNKALGVYGAVAGLGAVLGLLLGGSITEYLGWRWVLLVNVPAAVAVLVGTAVLMEGERERGRIDLAGAVTATLGLGSLVYGITRASTAGWTDPVTVACLVAAVVLLAGFQVVQRRRAAPMIPPRVLRDRARLGANLVAVFMGGGMLATFYFLTLYMQQVLGYSPMLTGLAYLPLALGIVIGSGVVGPVLLGRTSERTSIVVGMLLSAVGMAWFGLLAPETSPFAVLLPAQLVVGVGIGIGFVATTIVGVRGVAAQDAGIASGLINTSQQIGGAVGLAAVATVAVAVIASQPAGTALPVALTSGYVTGMLVGAALYLVATVVAAVTIPSAAQTSRTAIAGQEAA